MINNDTKFNRFMKRFFLTGFGIIGAGFLALTLTVLVYSSTPGAPDEREQADFAKILEKGLHTRVFALSEFGDGAWQFACIAGQGTQSLGALAKAYADANGFEAEPKEAFSGDADRRTAWALALYDQDGREVIYRLNERLLRYRDSDDPAEGHCFTAQSTQLMIRKGRLHTIDRDADPNGNAATILDTPEGTAL